VTEQLKQRIWGMIILVIVGVVFIPDLLDGKKQTTKNDFKKIPNPPVFQHQAEQIEFPKDAIDQTIEGAVDYSDERAIDEPETVSAEGSQSTDTISHTASADKVDENKAEFDVKSEKTQTQTNTVLVGTVNVNSIDEQSNGKQLNKQITKQIAKQPLWILQLGSFKHKENVIALQEKLEKEGIKTFIKPITTKAGLLSKVYVGPKQNKSDLVEVQKKLREVTGLEGKITQYTAIN
jgi:DedD protein